MKQKSAIKIKLMFKNSRIECNRKVMTIASRKVCLNNQRTLFKIQGQSQMHLLQRLKKSWSEDGKIGQH